MQVRSKAQGVQGNIPYNKKEATMKHAFIISLMLIVSFGQPALSAQESLIETVATGCKAELQTY
jgi:hypothetical protein